MASYSRRYAGTKAERQAAGLADLVEYVDARKLALLVEYLKPIASGKDRYRAAQFMLGIAGVRSYWSIRAAVAEAPK